MAGHKDQLIDPTDTEAFAKALKHFLHNRRARAKAKKWQTARALEYDVRIIGTKLLEVYISTLRSKKTRGGK
jgi:glycosyltransferase involved in cell wall biosynthesis